MVSVVKWLMILTAIAVYPFYRLWIAGGAVCDARERKRLRLSDKPKVL